MQALRSFQLTAFLVASFAASCALAETPADFIKTFEADARQNSASFAGFSAQRGEVFFNSTHGQEWSCSSCHTKDPSAAGKHAKTDKPIKPMAPAANGERFTSPAKVAKWFKRNCNDVVGRVCTAQEKGDVLTYLISLKK
jgi:hypothetical protein